MADVQIDNGNFTQIANVLLEKVSSAKLNGCQYAIVLQVWRYTYGFKRKEHELSAGFIAKATGYNTRQIQRDLKVLVDRKIIVQKVVNGISRTLSFNKNFDDWDTYGELADGVKDIGEKADGELYMEPTADKPMVTYGELADQEIKSFKQNKQITTSDENFENVRIAYRDLHGVIDLPIQDCTVVTKLLDESIPPDLIIEVMKEKYKPSVKTIRYYVEAIKEKHEGKERVVPMQRKRNEVDWDKVMRQLKEAEQHESRTGA